MAKRGMLCLLVAAVGVTFVIGLSGRATRGTNDKFTFDAANLKDTSVWTKVNDEPYRMGPPVAILCGIPTRESVESERKKNPHAQSYITVYVNNAGKEAMFAKQPQAFPVGSVIVKRKIANTIESSDPLLYTLMRKREAGYNPRLGDWEFAVVAANGKDIQGIGKLANCQSCHIQKRDSDFVFRPYLKSN